MTFGLSVYFILLTICIYHLENTWYARTDESTCTHLLCTEVATDKRKQVLVVQIRSRVRLLFVPLWGPPVFIEGSLHFSFFQGNGQKPKTDAPGHTL